MVSVPTRKTWQTFRDSYGISKGAVGGCNVGQALDDYHDKLTDSFAKNKTLADSLAKTLAKYLQKLDKKAVTATGKTFDKFKSEFTLKYVAQAEAAFEEFATMSGVKKAFAERVRLLQKEARKLKPGVELAALQKLRQGPVRGMLAASKQVKQYDPSALYDLWKPIDDGINELSDKSGQDALDDWAQRAIAAATKTDKIASETKLHE